MSRLVRFVKNSLYTSYCRMLGASIGKKSKINCKSDITFFKNLFIKNNSLIYKNASIYIGKNGSFKVGNSSHIAPNGYFLVENNSLTIGDDVAIGPNCSFFCSSNHPEGKDPLYRNNYIYGDIQIGNNVFMGAHTVVLPGTTIGNNCVIAANSVVNGTLEDGYIYGGSPCKKIKKVTRND